MTTSITSSPPINTTTNSTVLDCVQDTSVPGVCMVVSGAVMTGSALYCMCKEWSVRKSLRQRFICGVVTGIAGLCLTAGGSGAIANAPLTCRNVTSINGTNSTN